MRVQPPPTKKKERKKGEKKSDSVKYTSSAGGSLDDVISYLERNKWDWPDLAFCSKLNALFIIHQPPPSLLVDCTLKQSSVLNACLTQKCQTWCHTDTKPECLTSAKALPGGFTFSEGVMRYTASRLGSGSRRLLMSSTTRQQNSSPWWIREQNWWSWNQKPQREASFRLAWQKSTE